MKLSATAKIAIKSAYDYLQACQHPKGVTVWFRENFKNGDDHLALTTRVKIAKHNWNHLFNMGFSSSDIVALYKEVYPNEK